MLLSTAVNVTCTICAVMVIPFVQLAKCSNSQKFQLFQLHEDAGIAIHAGYRLHALEMPEAGVYEY